MNEPNTQPKEDKSHRDAELDEALDESFPASDPPSPARGGPDRPRTSYSENKGTGDR